MTLDREAARTRAEQMMAKIIGARSDAMALGTPEASNIGALPFAVASDVLALLDHGADQEEIAALREELDAARKKLATHDSAWKQEVDSLRDALRAMRAIASNALDEDEPIPFELDKAEPHEPCETLQNAPAIQGAPTALPSGRREELPIPVETWNPSNELLDSCPQDRVWVLGKLSEFKKVKAGESAKRWGVAFKAFLASELQKLAQPAPTG